MVVSSEITKYAGERRFSIGDEEIANISTLYIIISRSVTATGIVVLPNPILPPP